MTEAKSIILPTSINLAPSLLSFSAYYMQKNSLPPDTKLLFKASKHATVGVKAEDDEAVVIP